MTVLQPLPRSGTSPLPRSGTSLNSCGAWGRSWFRASCSGLPLLAGAQGGCPGQECLPRVGQGEDLASASCLLQFGQTKALLGAGEAALIGLCSGSGVSGCK